MACVVEISDPHLVQVSCIIWYNNTYPNLNHIRKSTYFRKFHLFWNLVSLDIIMEKYKRCCKYPIIRCNQIICIWSGITMQKGVWEESGYKLAGDVYGHSNVNITMNM